MNSFKFYFSVTLVIFVLLVCIVCIVDVCVVVAPVWQLHQIVVCQKIN